MQTVIVIAPFPTVRAGLTSLLMQEPESSVLASAEVVSRLPELLDRHLPDVVLIDLSENVPEDLRLLRDLARADSLPNIVLLFSSATDALEGLQLPGASLLLRDATTDEIQAAVRSAAQGLVSLDRRIADEISEQLGTGEGQVRLEGSVSLSPRELDVLQGVARGLPNKAIARELGISEHTVKFHLGTIFQKLEVSSRSEAIAAAARIGLLDLWL